MDPPYTTIMEGIPVPYGCLPVRLIQNFPMETSGTDSDYVPPFQSIDDMFCNKNSTGSGKGRTNLS